MKTNNIFLMILVIITSFCGCEKNDVEKDIDKGEVIFELKKTEFKKGETIRAYFINEKDHDIYRVTSSTSVSWLEKFKDENWESLFYGDTGLPVVTFLKVESGESVFIEYPYTKLEQMVENTEGIYRFSATISFTPDFKSDHKKIVSEEFTVE